MSIDDKLIRQNEEFKDRIDELYVLHDKLEKCLKEQNQNLRATIEYADKSRCNIEEKLKEFKQELSKQTKIREATDKVIHEMFRHELWLIGIIGGVFAAGFFLIKILT